MLDFIYPLEVRFFISLIYKDDCLDLFYEFWHKHFQTQEVFHPQFNPLLNYYQKEMGEGIKRLLVFDKNKKKREDLVKYKLLATSFEKDTSLEQKRVLNIDVGFIALEQVVLATTKPYAHRIYLQSGIYSELVYTYAQKKFTPLAWTYPDYQDPEKLLVFKKMRGWG